MYFNRFRRVCREFSIPVFKSTENQYHAQAPGWFSTIVGNRDTATAALVRRSVLVYLSPATQLHSERMRDNQPVDAGSIRARGRITGDA